MDSKNQMQKREIKFRAWDKTENVMSYSDVEMFDDMVGFRFGHFGINVDTVDDIELMQYTGLKDKNGQEIYEGDIVKMYDPYTKTIMTTEVIWDDPNCRFAMKYTFVDFDFLISDEIEVIGNVHENTELIKQEAEQ